MLVSHTAVIEPLGVSQLMVDTLKCIQGMSHCDLCVLSAIDSVAPWKTGSIDVDPLLMGSLRNMIGKSLAVYGNHLCLNELLDTYMQLLSLSGTSGVDYGPARRSVGDFLLTRIASGEKLPLSFDMCKFVDTFVVDLGKAHALSISDWALHRVKSLRSHNTSHEERIIPSQLLAVQRVWDTMGEVPVVSFVTAVQIFVSY